MRHYEISINDTRLNIGGQTIFKPTPIIVHADIQFPCIVVSLNIFTHIQPFVKKKKPLSYFAASFFFKEFQEILS